MERTMSAAAAGAAAAAAATIEAIRASGVVVRVEPASFADILMRTSSPLVVQATGGLISTNYQYLTSYKGLAFFTKSSTPLSLPASAEIINAKSIYIPG
jgi:hypothetical protein